MDFLKTIFFFVIGLLRNLWSWVKGHVNVLVAIASLITSVVTCQVSKEQTKIVDNQLEMQKKEAQPIFEIRKGLLDYDHDGCDDTECFSINIIKNEVQEICDVKTYTYYKIDEMQKNNNVPRIERTIYAPILWYHNSCGGSFGHTGTIVCDTTINNFWAYLEFKGDCMLKKLGETVAYSCDKIDFIEISYLDIYGTSHTVYYEDTSLSTKEHFLDICQKSKDVFGDHCYNLYVKLDHILSDLRGNINLRYE